MKKVSLIVVFYFAYSFSLHSQTLFGTTFYGGNDGGGTINKLIADKKNLIIEKSFESLASNFLPENLIQGKDGKLYGVTAGGGSNNAGVIFAFDPLTSTYTKLKDFDLASGSPIGGLLQAKDGKLYGVTVGGGGLGYGAIFSYNLSTSALAMLKEFDGASGAYPSGGLIQATNGLLYGMTSLGGSNGFPGSSGDGVLFSFDLMSSGYIKLKDFDFTNGSNPYGSLMQAKDGKLYGTTLQGGSSNVGVVFSFDPVSSTYLKLFDFDFTNGTNPSGSLVQARDGKLYGVTNGSRTTDYGVVFSFDPSSSNYSKLMDLDPTIGSNPYGGLIEANDGKLYGMTSRGGSHDAGVIFSFDPSTVAYRKLNDLDNNSGSSPYGSLLQANDGELYGMTSSTGTGGSTDDGVLFSFDPTSTTYKKLKEFGVNMHGSNISGGLMRARDGKLYGMTTNGGSNALGVIFSIDPSSSTYTKLVDFDYPNGSHPYGRLLQATDGKLYGLTPYGGFEPLSLDNNTGVIFSFDPASSVYNRVMKFDGYTYRTGTSPYGSLIQASDGKLYGMTSTGGGGFSGSGTGVIFSFDPSSSIYTRLKDFANFDVDGFYSNDLNGAYPYGSLIQATDGKLYGMTSSGGDKGYGVLFSYDPTNSTYNKLEQFDSSNGANPYGSLIQARDGKLYGMTWGGGTDDAGVIFSYDPSSGSFAKLKDFDFVNGSHPYGNLMQASDGKLYGMTSSGGSKDYGVIFSYDPISSGYTRLMDYDGANGANPYFGSGFIELGEPIPTPVPNINSLEEFRVFPNPNNGLFSVQMKLNTVKEVAFKLSNMIGQIIYQSPAYHFSGIQTKQFNGVKLAAGLYLLQTKIGDESFVQKIIINK